MDAQRSQENPSADPPRHLFFGAEDRRLAGRAGLEDKYLTPEKARRHQLAEHVINTANQLANAVRTLRSFDRTGSADMALEHLELTFEDLRKHTTNLVNEVNASVDRYGDAIDELSKREAPAAAPGTFPPPVNSAAVVESTPKAPAAADHQPSLSVVKPGPHLVAVATMGRNRAGR